MGRGGTEPGTSRFTERGSSWKGGVTATAPPSTWSCSTPKDVWNEHATLVLLRRTKAPMQMDGSISPAD